VPTAGNRPQRRQPAPRAAASEVEASGAAFHEAAGKRKNDFSPTPSLRLVTRGGPAAERTKTTYAASAKTHNTTAAQKTVSSRTAIIKPPRGCFTQEASLGAGKAILRALFRPRPHPASKRHSSAHPNYGREKEFGLPTINPRPVWTACGPCPNGNCGRIAPRADCANRSPAMPRVQRSAAALR